MDEDEQSNAAIADICQWRLTHAGAHVFYVTPEGKKINKNISGDLNAMHEAEKILTFSQGIEYGRRVHAILDNLSGGAPDFDLMAPARPRAEAFLHVFGKEVGHD